ncbi:MAG: cob(I)yrinic acid a,c-diamide adenosyltransferase [Acidimicrobiales bacterium]|nr:cob(I)yrinic acid a,c-diamide adenosyltransferase [Actinomycetota bacterium]
MRIYTRRGDDGTTGLLHGGRARKDAAVVEAGGAADEAQAAIGVARAHAPRDSELDRLLVDVERDLWVLMAELATSEEQRARLVPGRSLVTADMVGRLEPLIDDLSDRFDLPAEFVVPGQSVPSSYLDLARTVVRRAERRALAVVPDQSQVVPYLNRLSDLLWTMARWQEDGFLPARPDEEPA